MPVSTENIRRWIEQSNIDYVTYFIKAWIPFNAWYNDTYQSLDSDRAKINAIKRTPGDQIRKGINAYMEGSGQESNDFRNYLSALHHALEHAQLDSREGRISFTEIIKDRNSQNVIIESYNGITYYLKRDDGTKLSEVNQMLVTIKKSNGATIFNYQHTEYNGAHLSAQCVTNKISPTQAERVRVHFESLHPVIVTNAIESDSRARVETIYNLGSVNFKRDASDNYSPSNVIVRSLIEILYQLRNILFHGELNPNDKIQPVYKNAYFLLKMLLEHIR